MHDTELVEVRIRPLDTVYYEELSKGGEKVDYVDNEKVPSSRKKKMISYLRRTITYV